MMHLTNPETKAMLNLLLLNKKCGLGRSFVTGAGYAPSMVHGFFYVYLFMVGIIGGFRACRFQYPVDQPVMSAAQCLVALVGGNLTAVLEATMPNSTAVPLRTENQPLPFEIPAVTGEVLPIEALILEIPEFLETAAHLILSDFDYLANKEADTAIAIRILATLSDRLTAALENIK